MNPSGCGVSNASQDFLPHIHKNVGGENSFLNHLSSQPLSPPLLHSQKSNKSNNESNKILVTFGRGFCA